MIWSEMSDYYIQEKRWRLLTHHKKSVRTMALHPKEYVYSFAVLPVLSFEHQVHQDYDPFEH